ncbi:hypothetical protein BDW02DRAFT_567399 [Decorospora gaudefroyi]|uniref:Uncharacterized protein n=1 Tax=Decorospora gaudefroyi TaxID=184978 RepID=A0A6A5KIZ0_9PLEO|nr:hypothetical protein BDW02DRAFT_567399 [Decorospora gaudefroyi]
MGDAAGLFVGSCGLDREVLGLLVEDLNEATKAAVVLAKSGYWDWGLWDVRFLRWT